MPTIRIGFSSDFVLNNNRVGLGTTVAAGGNLDVDGAIKGNFSIAGVATLASYGGFVVQKQQIKKPSTIGFATVGLNTAGAAIGVGATQVANQYYETETGFTDLGGVHHGDDQYFNTLSGDLVIDDGQILNITNTDMVGVTTIGEYDPHNHSSYVCAGSLEQVSVTDHFSVPNGGINDRQLTPIEGTVRFNTDLATLEFFNGVEWRQFTYNQGQSGRMVMAGGITSPSDTYVSNIDYLSIPTLGNSTSFGDLSATRRRVGGVSSEIRGVFIRGTNSTNTRTNIMESITIASGGDAINFGDAGVTGSTIGDGDGGCCSSSTRGIQAGGGQPGNHNIITYIQINTTGNALDFGDLSEVKHQIASFSSSTRAIHYSGYISSGNFADRVDTHLISSTGNAVDFGEPLVPRYAGNACANSIRGIIPGGNGQGAPSSGFNHKSITMMNMSTQGTETNFGNISVGRGGMAASSSQTRGVFAGGYNPADVSTIDYVTIPTTGDAIDFGDLTSPRGGIFNGMSDSHGGLGGF